MPKQKLSQSAQAKIRATKAEAKIRARKNELKAEGYRLSPALTKQFNQDMRALTLTKAGKPRERYTKADIDQIKKIQERYEPARMNKKAYKTHEISQWFAATGGLLEERNNPIADMPGEPATIPIIGEYKQYATETKEQAQARFINRGLQQYIKSAKTPRVGDALRVVATTGEFQFPEIFKMTDSFDVKTLTIDYDALSEANQSKYSHEQLDQIEEILTALTKQQNLSKYGKEAATVQADQRRARKAGVKGVDEQAIFSFLLHSRYFQMMMDNGWDSDQIADLAVEIANSGSITDAHLEEFEEFFKTGDYEGFAARLSEILGKPINPETYGGKR